MFPVPFYFLPFYHFTSIFDFTSRAAPSHSEPLRGTHWGPSCIFWLCVLVHILAVLAASPLCIFWPRLSVVHIFWPRDPRLSVVHILALSNTKSTDRPHVRSEKDNE